MQWQLGLGLALVDRTPFGGSTHTQAGTCPSSCCIPTPSCLRYNIDMSIPLRRNGQMALVVNRVNLHEGDSDLEYWLSRDPAERIAAVEIIRQRIFGGADETRQGLQRVCRIIRR